MSDHRHDVEARINGFSVGHVAFEGFRGATLTGTIPASMLQAPANQLNLVYNATTKSGETSADGVVYLDYVDIAAPVAAPASVATIAGLTAYDGSLPAFKRVEYLIVTHPDFREAADRIAALKEGEGLSAAVVETDNAYDRWSGGIVEARAIQALVREAAAKSGRLKYVLLVGDDTFDPQDLSGFGARVFVPSLLSRDSGFGRIPSENLYADTDGDGAPDLAIGRLPAQTAEEAGMMADKIANQSALLAAQPNRNIFAIDNPKHDDAQFRAEAQEILRPRRHGDLGRRAPAQRRGRAGPGRRAEAERRDDVGLRVAVVPEPVGPVAGRGALPGAERRRAGQLRTRGDHAAGHASRALREGLPHARQRPVARRDHPQGQAGRARGTAQHARSDRRLQPDRRPGAQAAAVAALSR
jgi:hypothetical protein